jgi:hypothetical protein
MGKELIPIINKAITKAIRATGMVLTRAMEIINSPNATIL